MFEIMRLLAEEGIGSDISVHVVGKAGGNTQPSMHHTTGAKEKSSMNKSSGPE